MDKNNSETLNIKEIILALLSLASGFWAFKIWHDAIPAIIVGSLKTYMGVIYLVAPIVTAAALFSLVALFIKSKWLVFLFSALALSGPYLLIRADNTTIPAAAVTILLALWVAFRIRKEKNMSLGFSAHKILKAGMPLYFTTAAIVMAVFYFETVNPDTGVGIVQIVPKSVSRLILNLLSHQAESLVGVPLNIKPEVTVNEVLSQLIIAQSKKEGVSLSPMPSAQMDRLINLERRDLSARFGVNLRGDENILDAFHGIVVERLKGILGPYQSYLPLIAALAFFLAFKTFSWSLYYLMILLDLLLIKIAVSVKLLKSEKKQIEVQTLSL